MGLYKVRYVSLKANEEGKVLATFEPNQPQDPAFTPDKIRFVGSDGKTLTSTYDAASKQWNLTLPAAPTGESEVFAYYQAATGGAKSVGKLLVKRWDFKTKKLQIVKLGDAVSVDGGLATALSNIYKPALTKWEVSVGGKNINFDYKDGSMDAEGLASFSNYSAEMKALISAYFGGNRVDDPSTYYLFVVPGFKPADVKGYMPRGRNVGFVSDVSARNIAHELGHGAFGLKHTFDEQPASRSNLLDYGVGTDLTHSQWSSIQNPGVIINWFDDAEDAMFQSEIAYALCIQNPSAFKGKVFDIFKEGFKKLADGAEPYAFTVDDKLYSFKSGGKVYVPYKSSSNYWGYAPQGITPKVADKYIFEAAGGSSAVIIKQEQQAGGTTTLLLDNTPFAVSLCFQYATSDWLTEAGRGKLSGQLKALAANDTEITIKECGKSVSHTVTSAGTAATAGQKAIQIELCWDGSKWKNTIAQFSYSTTSAKAKGMTKIAEAGEAAKAAAQFALDNNKGIDAYSKISADGIHNFVVSGADAMESAVYFLETGKYLIENQQVPPASWQGGGANKKVLTIPPVLGGGTDQGLQEVKDLKQMVDLGVAFVKEPASTLGGIWDGITGIAWEDAASVAFGDWAERYKNYEKGSPHDWYQGGRDGVSVVKYFAAGGLFTITGGIKEMPAELKKKFDNVSDLWRGIAKNADDFLAAKVTRVKSLGSDVQVGYRGSLANGVKYNKKYVAGGDAPEYLPFNPESWDVDAFIVSDELAANPVFSRGGFRDGRLLSELNPICNELETAFKGANGYRTSAGKEFTYAIWTKVDFERKVKPFGYKLFE